MTRSTTEVLHDHLMRRLRGETERDIADNYADDVVILSSFATYRGHEGVRQSSALLAETLHGGEFVYSRTIVEGEFGFLEWAGHDGDTRVSDGADSYVVRDGRIVFQSIHYTAWPRE